MVLLLLRASELQASWPLQSSDKISLPIVVWSMQESKGLGAVGYRFSVRIAKQRQKCYKLGWNPDPSNSNLGGPAKNRPHPSVCLPKLLAESKG
jgi:hypothetical protein